MENLYACEETYLVNYLERIHNISEDEIKEKIQGFGEWDEEEKTDMLPVTFSGEDGEEASFEITGPLSKSGPSAIERFFGYGGTSYIAIVKTMEALEQRDSVKKIRILMDTPGGEVNGVDEAWQAIKKTAEKKEITAVNTGLLASGGYWLASAAQNIVANSPVNETGSIGVVIVQYDLNEWLKNRGIKKVRIISRNAPKKNPDGNTKAGKQTLQDRADAIERVFIKRIAEGRGIDEKFVIKNFGQGAVLVAQDPDSTKKDALKAGMIDEVEGGYQMAAQEYDDDEEGDQQEAMNTEAGKIETTIFPPEAMGQKVMAAATTFKDYPISDKAWDKSAADKRWRDYTKSLKEPSASYKNGFFWYDENDQKKYGSYKLPFVDIIDGKPHAVRNAVNAANAAMAGARGGVKIPSKDRSSVQAHIDRYRKKIDKQDQQKKKTEMQRQGAGIMETLSELLAANPKANEEFKLELQKAEKKGHDDLQGKVNQAIPYLESDEYPAPVKKLACGVLKGEKDISAIQSAVTIYDSIKEQEAAKNAAADSGDTPPTPPQGHDQPASPEGKTGDVKTEEDHKSEVDRFKKSR